MSLPATRFAGLGRGPALLVLAVAAMALIAFLVVALTPTVPPPSDSSSAEEFNPEASDWLFYRRVVEAVRSGKSYYEVVPAELGNRKFEAFSVFNYRPPLYAWFLAAIPETCARILLGAVVLAGLAMTFAALQGQLGPKLAGVGVLLLASGLLWCVVPVAIYAHELWTGAFIALSVASYGQGRRLTGMATGLMALFFRELTLPYCLIAAFFAVRQRRRAEIICWIIGLVLYGAYMVAHIRAVRQIMPAQTTRGALEWVQFGGIPFLLSTTRMNFLVIFLPDWAAAVYLPLALLGLSGWKGEMGTRSFSTAAVYTLGFSLVGQAMNGYWGFVDAPLLALGLLWLPAVIRDLLREATGRDARSCPALLDEAQSKQNSSSGG